MRRRLIRTLIGAVAVIVLGIFVFVIMSVRMSLQAERNLQAMLNAINACAKFVELNDGRWPRSPADLEPQYSDRREWLPMDHVHIDFDSNPSELAKQSPESFTGITVDDPVYDHTLEIDSLIKLLGKYHDADKN